MDQQAWSFPTLLYKINEKIYTCFTNTKRKSVKAPQVNRVAWKKASQGLEEKTEAMAILHTITRTNIDIHEGIFTIYL